MLSKKVSFLGGVFVMLATFAVFSSVLGFEFVNRGDTVYVLENPHFQPPTIMSTLWFFTHVYAHSWNPIAMVSHAFDVSIWHFEPFGHHLTNVVLHSINAGLVLWIALHILDAFRLRSADRNVSEGSASPAGNLSLVAGSIFAASVFSLHPLRVESVAWVSERKDLLCTFFMLLASIIYFTRREDPNRLLSNKWLIVSFYLFALGSHSIAIVLPFAFMLVDALLFKYKFLENVKDKAPLILLAIASGIIATIAATGMEGDFVAGEATTLQRIAFPFSALLFYVSKFLLPLQLTSLYHPSGFLPSASVPMLILVPVIVAAITWLSVWKWKQGRTHWLVAWLVFALFFAPTILSMYSGNQPIAGRYTYAASIALAILAGGGVERLLRGQTQRTVSLKSAGLVAVCVVYLFFLGCQAVRQLHVWNDSSTLWASIGTCGVPACIPIGSAESQQVLRNRGFSW